MHGEHRPPPAHPTRVTPEQRSAIEGVIGRDASPDLVRAIRDARGRTFQRLEFLGDPLLESIESMLSVVGDQRSSDHHATTDFALAQQAERLGVTAWLEWDPSDQRAADLVEAIAGAAFLTAGWQQVGTVYAAMSAPLPPSIAELLVLPERTSQPPDDPTRIDRPLATLGSSMLEAASTIAVYTADPAADEGGLSTLRRDLHQTRIVAAWADRHALTHPTKVVSMTSDVVETWLGDVALHDGPATAVGAAIDVLLDGRAALEASS